VLLPYDLLKTLAIFARSSIRALRRRMSHQDSLYPMRLHQQQSTQPETGLQQPLQQDAKQQSAIYGMGFDPHFVTLAMRKCDGDETRAIECILNEGAVDEDVVPPRAALQVRSARDDVLSLLSYCNFSSSSSSNNNNNTTSSSSSISISITTTTIIWLMLHKLLPPQHLAYLLWRLT
jgi:hypothetical protein